MRCSEPGHRALVAIHASELGLFDEIETMLDQKLDTAIREFVPTEAAAAKRPDGRFDSVPSRHGNIPSAVCVPIADL